MKAIVCTKYGPPDVLQLKDVPKPAPKDNEVLIRVHASTATTAGLTGRTGKPYFARVFSGFSKPKKDILGIEISGEIVEVGATVTRFKIGDPIFGLTGATNPGAYAEFKTIPADGPIELKPDTMSFEDAVAVVEGGLTALNFLKHKANLQSGQRILINGASGAVGTSSIQIAKIFGAEVTGVCSAANFDLVQSLGADHVIDYTQEDFTKNGQTYDVIFDTVGKRSFSECKGSLKPNGFYLDPAGVATLIPMLWTSMFGRKRAILAATYLRSDSENRQDLLALKALAEEEKIWPVIDRRYELEQTAEAHRYVETGRKKGNVVISVAAV
ncbi:MAG: NAD(P)-dependent alcohol dehydrogenase [Anaerolineae bacterium]